MGAQWRERVLRDGFRPFLGAMKKRKEERKKGTSRADSARKRDEFYDPVYAARVALHNVDRRTPPGCNKMQSMHARARGRPSCRVRGVFGDIVVILFSTRFRP